MNMKLFPEVSWIPLFSIRIIDGSPRSAHDRASTQDNSIHFRWVPQGPLLNIISFFFWFSDLPPRRGEVVRKRHYNVEKNGRISMKRTEHYLEIREGRDDYFWDYKPEKKMPKLFHSGAMSSDARAVQRCQEASLQMKKYPWRIWRQDATAVSLYVNYYHFHSL